MNGIAANGFKMPALQGSSARQYAAAASQKQKAAAKAAITRFESALPNGESEQQQRTHVLAQLKKINSSLNRKLQFVLNHDSKQVTVNVIDANTQKVIKVLPPKELQRLNAKLMEKSGVLLDEKI
ncbi:MAG: hypothetical protein Ta2G_09440 [Termitinemataceae bacterium]|nr:MAG: hypothetical protein Ta2G_09440 [Termitinemataceae bacterium]